MSEQTTTTGTTLEKRKLCKTLERFEIVEFYRLPNGECWATVKGQPGWTGRGRDHIDALRNLCHMAASFDARSAGMAS